MKKRFQHDKMIMKLMKAPGSSCPNSFVQRKKGVASLYTSIIKTFQMKMIEYVGMSKPKKYVNKVGMCNSRNKIKQTNSYISTRH